MLAVYKRELKSCFCSFVGFLFIAFTLFFVGLYFTVYGLISGSAYYSYVISSVTVMFLLTIPILTMRVLAEERRNKTDQMILTAPVSVGGIVMGKFLALVTVYAIPTAITCFYPMVLSFFGNVPVAENFVAVIAFFIFGVTCIAIGIFVSSLTESQVIAAVLTFLFLFLGYMMNSICSVLSTTGNLLTKILTCFDLTTPMNTLLNGTLDLVSVFYFISLTALFLFLTVQSIQKRRYSISLKHFSIGAYSGVSIAAAVAIVIAANMILSEMPGTWTKVDLTGQKIYSLTDATKEFLKTLDEDVSIYVMIDEDSKDPILAETLERYEDLSEHISVEYVDPTLNPRFHTQYTNQSFALNSLIVVSEKRSKLINSSDVYQTETQYAADYSSYTTNITGYDGEGLITSALAYVTAEDMPEFYFLEGHGESALSQTFLDALDRENIVYETINLMNSDSVPENAACLMINAPVSDLNADDAEKVLDYLKQGGKVIAVAAITEEPLTNYEKIFDYMGLKLINGLVVENDTNHYYQLPYYILPELNSNVYTDGVAGYYYAFMPFCMGMVIEDEEAEDTVYQELFTTTDNSYVQVDISRDVDFTKKDGDVDGPFVLGAEAVKTVQKASESTEEVKATLVAISCGQMLTENANAVVSGANKTIFGNIAAEFCEYEVNVFIPAKDYSISAIMMPRSYVIGISIVVMGVLPIAFLAAGLTIWLRRRKR